MILVKILLLMREVTLVFQQHNTLFDFKPTDVVTVCKQTGE